MGIKSSLQRCGENVFIDNMLADSDISDVSIVASNIKDIVTVADNIDAIKQSNTNAADVSLVGSNIEAVKEVADNIDSINAVYRELDNIEDSLIVLEQYVLDSANNAHIANTASIESRVNAEVSNSASLASAASAVSSQKYASAAAIYLNEVRQLTSGIDVTHSQLTEAVDIAINSANTSSNAAEKAKQYRDSAHIDAAQASTKATEASASQLQASINETNTKGYVDVVAVSANSAKDYSNNSLSYAGDSKKYRDQIEVITTDTINQVERIVSSLGDTGAHSQSAAASAIQAQIYAGSASVSVGIVNTAKQAAEVAATSSYNSSVSAAQDRASATSSELNARQYMEAAKLHAGDVVHSVEDSELSAKLAERSAKDAKISEVNSKTSEIESKKHETASFNSALRSEAAESLAFSSAVKSEDASKVSLAAKVQAEQSVQEAELINQEVKDNMTMFASSIIALSTSVTKNQTLIAHYHFH